MKTAVSVPDDVFRDAELTAARLGYSRSRLYTEALRSFINNQVDDPVTAKLNEIADELNRNSTSIQTARELIESGQWEW